MLFDMCMVHKNQVQKNNTKRNEKTQKEKLSLSINIQFPQPDSVCSFSNVFVPGIGAH